MGWGNLLEDSLANISMIICLSYMFAQRAGCHQSKVHMYEEHNCSFSLQPAGCPLSHGMVTCYVICPSQKACYVCLSVFYSTIYGYYNVVMVSVA